MDNIFVYILWFAIFFGFYLFRRSKIKEGKTYKGKIIDVKGLDRNFIIEVEINGELKTLKSLEICPLAFSKNDYIGKKVEIYYNKDNPTRCSLVCNNKFTLKNHLED